MENPFRIDGFQTVTIEWVAQALAMQRSAPSAPLATPARKINGITTDSRLVQSGDLFIPIRGENADGHKFIASACKAGVAAVVCEQLPPEAAQLQNQTGVEFILVRNTLAALGDLARHWRQQFKIPIVALTGSNGKTTTKELIGSICQQVAPTLITWGNLNNQIGVPLMLLRLRAEHRYAVIEMGMNHFGEIERLTEITLPKVRLITNVMPVHLEGVGSLEGVAKAKGEILTGISTDDFFVCNEDDPHIRQLSAKQQGRKVSYSLQQKDQTDVFLQTLQDLGVEGYRGTLKAGAEGLEFQLRLPGRHNLNNMLAATAVAMALKIPTSSIAAGLAAAKSAPKRSEWIRLNTATLYNDCYNANPESMVAALKTLAEVAKKRKVAVLGDMGELGKAATSSHEQVIESCHYFKMDRVFLFGSHFSAVLKKNPRPGYSAFLEIEKLQSQLAKALEAGDTILIKGSRSQQMERVTEFLIRKLTPKGEQGEV